MPVYPVLLIGESGYASSGITTMEHCSERRSCRRVIVGPEHTIRFSANGHSFQNVRITNVSITGCFAMVSPRDAGLFAQGTLLERFAFEHPALAAGSITAKVMYVLGGANDGAALEFMGVGIHFVGMDDDSARRLADFIAQSS